MRLASFDPEQNVLSVCLYRPFCCVPLQWSCGAKTNADQRIELAAARMSRVVASGCEIIATCDESTSTVVACARCAMNRSVAGGMAWSCVATMYHDGIVFHAGSPDGATNASLENGRCVACIWSATLSGWSPANASWNADFFMYRSIPVPPPGSG